LLWQTLSLCVAAGTSTVDRYELSKNRCIFQLNIYPAILTIVLLCLGNPQPKSSSPGQADNIKKFKLPLRKLFFPSGWKVIVPFFAISKYKNCCVFENNN